MGDACQVDVAVIASRSPTINKSGTDWSESSAVSETGRSSDSALFGGYHTDIHFGNGGEDSEVQCSFTDPLTNERGEDCRCRGANSAENKYGHSVGNLETRTSNLAFSDHRERADTTKSEGSAFTNFGKLPCEDSVNIYQNIADIRDRSETTEATSEVSRDNFLVDESFKNYLSPDTPEHNISTKAQTSPAGVAYRSYDCYQDNSSYPAVQSSQQRIDLLTGNMTGSFSSLICLGLCCILTAFAALNSRPVMLPLSQHAPAVPFFRMHSPVTDLYTGDLTTALSRTAHRQLTLLYLYAPWDLESQQGRTVMERVLHVLHGQLSVLAVNCWHPAGVCRRQLKKIHSFPVLIFYLRSGNGIQYTGALDAAQLVSFSERLLRPLARIDTVRDLHLLRAQHSALAIGFFPFSGVRSPPGYGAFLRAALSAVHQTTQATHQQAVAFAVVTSRTAALRLGLHHPGGVTVVSWNLTSVLKPPVAGFLSADQIGTYVSSRRRQMAEWLQLPPTKSATLHQIVERGAALLVPVAASGGANAPNSQHTALVQQVWLDYHNCNRSQSVSRLIHLIDSIWREISAEETRLLASCRHSTDARSEKADATSESADGERRLGDEFADDKRKRLRTSAGLIDDRVWQMRQQWRRTRCASLYLSRDSPEPEDQIQCSDGEQPTQQQQQQKAANITGMHCISNRTLSIYLLEARRHGALLDRLGLSACRHSAVILDAEAESQYVLESALSASTLSNFIYNYTRHRLPRFLASRRERAAAGAATSRCPHTTCLANQDATVNRLVEPSKVGGGGNRVLEMDSTRSRRDFWVTSVGREEKEGQQGLSRAVSSVRSEGGSEKTCADDKAVSCEGYTDEARLFTSENRQSLNENGEVNLRSESVGEAEVSSSTDKSMESSSNGKYDAVTDKRIQNMGQNVDHAENVGGMESHPGSTSNYRHATHMDISFFGDTPHRTSIQSKEHVSRNLWDALRSSGMQYLMGLFQHNTFPTGSTSAAGSRSDGENLHRYSSTSCSGGLAEKHCGGVSSTAVPPGGGPVCLAGAPKPHRMAGTAQLTSETFMDVALNKSQDVIVLYHAAGCGYCGAIFSVFLSVQRLCANQKLVFATIDGSSNDLPWHFSMDAFPTILYLPAHRKAESRIFPTHFPITVAHLLRFVLANASPSVRRSLLRRHHSHIPVSHATRASAARLQMTAVRRLFSQKYTPSILLNLETQKLAKLRRDLVLVKDEL